jgi:hypothetical protein
MMTTPLCTSMNKEWRLFVDHRGQLKARWSAQRLCSTGGSQRKHPLRRRIGSTFKSRVGEKCLASTHTVGACPTGQRTPTLWSTVRAQTQIFLSYSKFRQLNAYQVFRPLPHLKPFLQKPNWSHKLVVPIQVFSWDPCHSLTFTTRTTIDSIYSF